MTDFLLNANWILVLGVVGAVAILVYQAYMGHLIDPEDDGIPNWLRAHYRSKRR